MPVFHVDISVGDSLAEDLEGVEFPNLEVAEAHCIAGLVAVAKSLLTAHTRQRITTILRDGARNRLLERTLTVTCELR
jgi:hypothetical protein